MRTLGLFCILLGFLLSAASLAGQNVNMSHPEEIHAQKHPSPEEMRDRLADARLQKDAGELSDLCASLTSDMDGLKKGLLSKDVLDRLKRMEKLSKHLREQLAQLPVNP